MIDTIILLLLIVLDKIFGLLHPQESDVHSSNHLNRADMLLHPRQVSLKILVWNLTSLNVLLAVVVDLVVVVGVAASLGGEIWCGNTFFMICHLCFVLSFSLSLICSYFILSFYFGYVFCILWLCHIRFTTACLYVYSHS